jgi:hypothetical protein
VEPASRVDVGGRREGKCSRQCYFEAGCLGVEMSNKCRERKMKENIYMSKVREGKRKDSEPCKQ